MVLCSSGPIQAQEVEPEPDPQAQELHLQSQMPRVYLDCSSCDDGYIRREIPFLNYVRDRQQAQVHVLITDEPTGSGGRAYTIHLIGLDTFEGEDFELARLCHAAVGYAG